MNNFGALGKSCAASRWYQLTLCKHHHRNQNSYSYFLLTFLLFISSIYMMRHCTVPLNLTLQVPSVLNSWANEPKRYEVYQTRAERAAERNTTGTSAATNTNHYSSSYRTNTTTPSSNWTADHRLSLHDRTTTDRPTSYTPGGAYRSRFDDNFLYRRSAYDVERELTAGLTGK
jgi:hypothetical protein